MSLISHHRHSQMLQRQEQNNTHQTNIVFVTDLFDILNNDCKTVIFEHIFIIEALQVYIFRNETPICQKEHTFYGHFFNI